MLEFPYRGQPGLARLHVAAAAAAAVAAIATASAASAAMPSPLSAPAASLTPCRRRRRAAALGAPLPPRCRSRRALPLACASERAPVRMHAPELARGCTASRANRDSVHVPGTAAWCASRIQDQHTWLIILMVICFELDLKAFIIHEMRAM